MKIGGLKIWKEKPGIVSHGSAWCASYSCYLHICDSLPSLLWELVTERGHDRHLVG